MKRKHIGQFSSGSPHCSSPDPWSDCATVSFCISFLKEGYCFHYKVIPTVITNYLPKYSQWQPFKWVYTQFSPCLVFTWHPKEAVSCCCKNLNSFRAFSFQVTEQYCTAGCIKYWTPNETPAINSPRWNYYHLTNQTKIKKVDNLFWHCLCNCK